jgi:mycothiol synthase
VISGLSVRAGTDADFERLVEFQNRYARPGRTTSLELSRRFEAANPEPNRLVLVADDANGTLIATATASDGGLMGGGQNRWRAGIRVAPEHRRRGIASEMLARLEAHVRAKGAPKLQSSVRGEEEDGLRFAEKHGYTEFHRRFDSYLDVPEFDASRFDDPKAMAARAGVRIDRYDVLEKEAKDRVAFQRGTYESMTTTQMDIPRPEPMPQPPPFEAVREVYFEGETFARDSTMIALRGDRVVGTSVTIIDPEGVAYTVYTGVDKAERGKGIALAMKLAILQRLKERGTKLFGTTNDEANAPMRGINAKLGYVISPPTIEVEKVFAP